MPKTGSPVVHFKFDLVHPVEDHLYEYLTDETS
jgi:hypothetical protein